MVRETLGDQIDIHGGGADLIFPHHENEIAQSEVRRRARCRFRGTGSTRAWWSSPVATRWRTRRTTSPRLRRSSIATIRKPCATSCWRRSIARHSRSRSSSPTAGRGARHRGRARALGRLRRALGPEPLDADGPLDTAVVDAFTAAMDADFNTPDALSVIFDLARDINRCRAEGGNPDVQRRTLVRLLGILGLDLADVAASDGQAVEPFIELLLEVRRELRGVKQYALADSVRTRLGDLGVIVEDKPGGTSTWRLDD